jgi:hypothetical protein
MRIDATKGKQGIGTEVKDATYVEAARWGKHRGWWYVLGLAIVLFAWLVVGSVGSAIVAFALDGREGFAAFRRADLATLGSVGSFLVIMAGFPFFLAGILLTVSFIHRRHPRTLITAREKIRWHRIGQGFVAWFVPFCLIGGLGQYLVLRLLHRHRSGMGCCLASGWHHRACHWRALREQYWRHTRGQCSWKCRDYDGSVHNQRISRDLRSTINTGCNTCVPGEPTGCSSRSRPNPFPRATRRVVGDPGKSRTHQQLKSATR